MVKSIIWACVGVAIGLGIGVFYSANTANSLQTENSRLVEQTLNLSYKIQQQSELIVSLQTQLNGQNQGIAQQTTQGHTIEQDAETSIALDTTLPSDTTALTKEDKIATLERDKQELENRLESLTTYCESYKKDENTYSEIDPCDWVDITKDKIAQIEQELAQI